MALITMEPFLATVKAYLPDKRSLRFALTFLVLGAIVQLGLSRRENGPAPPGKAGDLTAIGKAYGPNLAKVYASALEAGATSLEQGTAVSVSLDAIHDRFAADRLALFRKYLAPELAKVVPEAKPDPDVTPPERAGLVKALRAIATGLRLTR